MARRRSYLAPLPAASLDELFQFVRVAGRSVFDPWWMTPSADEAFKSWKRRA